MTEEEYLRLVYRSKEFCRNLPVNHIDFLHDILCSVDIYSGNNYLDLFYKKRREIRPKIYSYSEDFNSKSNYLGYIEVETLHLKQRITHYEYCYHCNQVLPEHELSSNGEKICKAGYNEKSIGRKRNSKNHTVNQKRLQKNVRDNLSDSYIKDILRKQGTVITEESIKEKRNKLLEKRKKRLIIKRESSLFL